MIELEHEQYIADIKATFGTPHGKRVFTKLLGAAAVNAPLTTNHEQLPEISAVRNFGINYLLGPVLEADPEIYFSIFREQINESKKQEEQDNARS